MTANRFAIATVLFCMSLFIAPALATTEILYVDESLSTGSDDGSDWDNAFRGSTALQEALDEADTLLGGGSPPTLVEIWVEKGTYKPSKRTDTEVARSETFLMADKVHLYGGFADCQASSTNCDNKNDRKYACVAGANGGRPCEADAECPGSTCDANDTILSGDIGTVDVTSDNTYHVVTHAIDSATASVVIDGFITKLGNANGSGIDNQGGGLQIRTGDVCIDGGPTVKNCLFRDNNASNHAAVNDHATASLYDNCVFRDNTAANGAGIVVDNGNGTSLTDCLFVGNDAGSGVKEGGGAWIGCRSGETGCPSNCSVTFTNCEFDLNTAERGGALWATGGKVTVTDGLFTNNDAQTTCEATNPAADNAQGGAVWFSTMAAGTSITGSDFTNNTSDEGGAVFIIDSNNTPTIADCNFVDNGTDCPGTVYYVIFSGGGALWTEDSNTLIKGSVFDSNEAIGFGQYGGALWSLNAATTIENSIFSDNRAYTAAGAIWTQTESGETVQKDLYVNCVFVGNHPFSNMIAGSIYMAVTELELKTCTFADNEGTMFTGGVYVVGDPVAGDELTATNCIFWANTSNATTKLNQINTASGGTADVRDSIWEGHGGDVGLNIIDDNPDFVTDYTNLRLKTVSPARDAGDNDEISGYTKDLDDKDRRIHKNQSVCATVDFGPYEFGASGCCDGGGTCGGLDGSTCCGQVCCSSTCTAGDCCDDTDCAGNEVCCGKTCVVGDCCDIEDCPGVEKCCDNTCQATACCDDSDCQIPRYPYCCFGSCSRFACW